MIELLAIIVILAIIMVVTIPTVLSSMGTAREDMFQTSANTVADWVEKQYTQAMMQTYDPAFTKLCTASNGYCTTTALSGNTSSNSAISSSTYTSYDFLKAAGVEPTNYSLITVQVKNGRACVTLKAATGGDFGSFAGQTKSSTGC